MKKDKSGTMENVGRLHAIGCEWCGLKMACNCFYDEIRRGEYGEHPLVMCPKCQVTEFLNLLFGRDGRDQRRGSQ
jgi:hypothetical protein